MNRDVSLVDFVVLEQFLGLELSPDFERCLGPGLRLDLGQHPGLFQRLFLLRRLGVPLQHGHKG